MPDGSKTSSPILNRLAFFHHLENLLGRQVQGQVMLFVLFGVLLFALPEILDTVEERAFVGSILVLLYLLTPIEVLLGALPQLGQAGAVVRQAEELGAAA